MYKHTQRSFAGGRLDAELMGRQDLQKYFQGASELKNFTVRRQGYISKRRGTDLAADLEHLLGHTDTTTTVDGQETTVSTPNAIGKAKLIPIVNERDKGYCVLLTAGRAFLVGDRGVRLMDGTWARSVADYELTNYANETVADDKRPYYVAVPYTDAEIAALNYTQSGDTIFLAHKSHAPAKLVRREETLEYAKLEFVTGTWAKPRITNITAAGSFGPQTAALKTVYYVCTYVKDGIESEPSQPVAYSYRMPWGEQATLTVTCDKGNNAEDPDYYNIYKKDSTEFGLIATSGVSQPVTLTDYDLNPGGSAPTVESQYLYTFSHYNPISYTRQLSDYFNAIGLPIADNAIAWEDVPVVCGGVKTTDAGLTIDLGPASGQMITNITVDLDAFHSERHFNENGPWNTHMIKVLFAGTLFRCTLTTADLDGTNEQTFYAYASAMNPKKVPSSASQWTPDALTEDLAPGENYIWNKSYNSWVSSYYGPSGMQLDTFYKRSVGFDFLSQLEAHYTDSSTSSGGRSRQWQVKSIKIEAYSNAADTTQPGATSGDDQYLIPLYFNGIAFDSRFGRNDTFIDDFITPDLSLTPPATEDHFNAAGDYPSAVAIHKQRLVFAATENDPFTFWLSQIGDLYNFSPHSSIREDDAISGTTDATEFPQINHLIVNRDLMAFADSGEWRIAPSSGNALTYKTTNANMQSAIGSSKTLKPIAVGDEIVFADRTGQRLYATRYNWSSDGYESNDLSVLSQWLFKNNPIVAMAYRQHPDSTIECVLEDGTMATLVYMKEHEVCAWSRAALGGGWLAKDIACTKAISNGSSEVMVLVERDGAYRLWRMRDDIPVRGGAVEAADQLCMDGARVLAVGETAASDETVVDCGTKLVAGYAFETTLVTVRPEVQGSNRTIQFELKNAKDAEVRVLDSGDFSCRATGVPAQLATKANANAEVSTQYGTVELKSGDYKLTLAGDSTGDGRVEVKSATVMPLNILSISVDYEIQPLSESEG